SIVGKSIQLNRVLGTIVGVTPPEFQGCKTGLRTDLWVSLGNSGARLRERDNNWLNVLGRLNPGVTRGQAERELDLQMQGIARQFPDSHRGPNQISLDPLWRSPFGANVYLYKSLPMLLALAAALLVLACANVANLLLVRSVARRREVALRLSLGANRWRLVRQLLVEFLLLGLAGGGVGLALTTWTAGTFAAFFPPTANIPLALNRHLDGRVFLVTMAVSLLSALAFGILPAVRISALAPFAVLKEEAGTTTGGIEKMRLSSALVVAQIALSLLLLICAGLFTRSLQNARRLDPGFDPHNVLLASYELGPAGYSRAAGLAFHHQMLAKLAVLPGVEAATLADFSPLSFSIHADVVQPDGYVPQPGESMEIDRAVVGPDFFGTLRTPLLAGREFTEQDGEKSQLVAIVNQAFCDRYWPGQDPLGKRVNYNGNWFNVVGVARNGKYRRLVYAPAPAIFVSLFQDYRNLVTIHARVTGDPQAYAAAVERAVHDLNADLPLFGVTTLESSMRLGSIFELVAGTFAGAFGILSLVLAAVGIYGVIAYTTRQRTHEVAIRMAMGAQRYDVLRLILAQGLFLTFAGLTVGFVASLVLTRYLKSLLFGISTTDAATYTAVAVLLGLISMAACYVPARRATQVNPMTALKYE
ncbi:MAG TPA: ADOP family duplicated permease, partial [Terriglobia bacterium]|nr:ADOP family duplicated permease [Terriglobia bacterium]